MMKIMEILKPRLLFVGVLLLILVLGVNFYNDRGMSQAEKMVPTVTGLDFDKVDFWLDTQPEFYDRLFTRAIDKLTKAALYKADRREATSEKIATLRLSLDPRPLNGTCSGKVMYVQKLELWESVRPSRNPEISTSSVTWSYGLSIPVVTDRVTIEQLETDLDQFLLEFIRAYKIGNPSKK